MTVALIIFTFAMAFIIPWVLTLFLSPKWKPRTLRLQLSYLYCGFLCVLMALCIGTIGLLGDIFHREIEQTLSWLALVLGFLISGIMSLAWAYTAKVVVTDKGLEQYGPSGHRTLLWSAIDAVRFEPQAGFRVFAGKRRLVTIPLGSGDIVNFLDACDRHGIIVHDFTRDEPPAA